MALQVIKK
jgi:hypothetical protein